MSISKSYIDEILKRAEAAKEKPSQIGPDIDLNAYKGYIERGRLESLELLPKHAKEAALMSGIELKEDNRSGSYLQMDNSVVYQRLSKAYEGKVEMMDTEEAVKLYDGMEAYYWNLIKPASTVSFLSDVCWLDTEMLS
jgi:hypothetical protein